MDTVVNIQVVTAQPESAWMPALERAFLAFGQVERVCSRFQSQSEVSRLSAQVGIPVAVSDLLLQAMRFACEMAELTEGAFDPTVGAKLESYGFNRDYLTGETRHSGYEHRGPVSYRDITVDEANRTILLGRPLVVDLGAVAKGLAVDLAVRELASFEGFVIDAGGDIYVGGQNLQGSDWQIGIQHPREAESTICALRLTNASVCTSGNYERISRVAAGIHHLIDPRSGLSRNDLVSCTVVAPFAMLADAMSTAAYVMGPEKGMALLESCGLDGLFVDSALTIYTTQNMARYLA